MPQSVPSLVFADCIDLLHLCLQEYNQSDFGIDNLVMSVCRIISSVVGSEYFLWPVSSLGKTLLPCFILYSKAKLACYSRYLLTSYFCILVPYDEKDMLFWVLVLEVLVGLHRTVQLQLLWHFWLGHRLGLMGYWMACLGKKQRSFCCFLYCTQVLLFRLLCWLWGLLHFF